MASGAADDPTGGFQALVDAVLDGDRSEDPVRLDTILARVGERSYGSLLMLLGLANVLPVGAIPGFPILTLTLTALVAGQMLAGRDYLWLPGRLRRLRVSRQRLEAGAGRARGVARRLDRLVGPRQLWAAGPTAQRLAAAVSILLSLTMLPLGLIPFGVALPGLAMAVLGLAIMVGDGLVMILGGVVTLAAAAGIGALLL